jgi:tetratricopeptide (TPR) repeat protein
MTEMSEGSALCARAEDVAAYLGGTLSESEARALEAHAADCNACRELLSALVRLTTAVDVEGTTLIDEAVIAQAAPEHEPLHVGSTVGRYLVLERLGMGGMGIVYAAYDPELERRIALKIVRADPLGDDARAAMHERLLREARAMAQLAHPNVVAVYDLGRHGEQVFIAMEVVEGQTLDAWLGARRRSWREVVDVFLGAGKGLAAAHAAGLVHRDFKPANVLIGRDGRARVTDFGLVHAAVAESVEWDAPASKLATDAPARGMLTPLGALIGTPSYMAPEQFRREPADARSDQFSFCVALYRALYAVHPFPGGTVRELATAADAGPPLPRPAGMGVPRRLHRAVVRGLSIAPADRHPSMHALLDALENVSRRRSRTLTIAAMASAAVAAAVVHQLVRDAPAACSDVGPQLERVWGRERRQLVERDFLATGKPYAAAAFTEVTRLLDGYTRRWADMRVEVCTAAASSGDPPAALTALRMTCLDARLGEVRALSDRLVGASAGTVEHAPAAVHTLPDLVGCADPRTLLGPLAPPAEQSARIAALRNELAAVNAIQQLGRYAEALDKARGLATMVAGLQFRPLEAEAQYLVGRAADGAGRTVEAQTALNQAVLSAEAGRNDELTARALIRLMTVKSDAGQNAEGLALAPRVSALIERIGGHDELEGLLHREKAGLLRNANRYAEAQVEGRAAVALFERRFGPDDLRIPPALTLLAELAGHGVEPSEALALARRGLAINRLVYGDAHPETAHAHHTVANALSKLGRFDEASAALEQALQIRERALGPSHPLIANTLAELSITYRSQLALADALKAIHRAVGIAEATYGRRHVLYASMLSEEGIDLLLVGRPREALPKVREGLDILLALPEPDEVEVGNSRRYLAQVLQELGRAAEARHEVVASIEIHERTLGPESWSISDSYRILTEVELDLGHAEAALRAIQRARTLAERGEDFDDVSRALLDFALARVLWALHQPPARSLALVRAAHATFAARPYGDWLRRTELWLAKHR